MEHTQRERERKAGTKQTEESRVESRASLPKTRWNLHYEAYLGTDRRHEWLFKSS